MNRFDQRLRKLEEEDGEYDAIIFVKPEESTAEAIAKLKASRTDITDDAKILVLS